MKNGLISCRNLWCLLVLLLSTEKYLIMVMVSSILSGFHVHIFSCHFTLLFLNFVPSYADRVSYAVHCSSIVLESTLSIDMPLTRYSLQPQVQDGFYTGGDRILSLNPSPTSSSIPNWIQLWIKSLYLTEAKKVFKVEAELKVESRNGDNYIDTLTYAYTSSIRFKLDGFWDESSGKLCMVGSSSTKTRAGTLLELPVLLELNSFKNSSNITSLVTGTLRSLNFANDSNFFHPVSILMFPHLNYKYTLVSKEMLDTSSDGSNGLSSLSLGSVPIQHFCRFLPWSENNRFYLTYGKNCSPTTNCNPFSGPDEHMPPVMRLNGVVHRRFCSEDGQTIRLLIDFSGGSNVGYYRPFNPKAALVAEGLWDEKQNQLSLVACRVLNASDSLADARIDDCSTRLSLRFPAVWSIRERSSIVGEFWSTKPVNDSWYFNKIIFHSAENTEKVAGLIYEYTETDRMPELCSRKSKSRMRERFPNGHSFGMVLHDMIVKNADGKTLKGYSTPLSVGDQFYASYSYHDSLSRENDSNNPVSISYKMSFAVSSGEKKEVKISAEGVYDAQTGSLCMVGCKSLVLDSQMLENLDCAIVVNLQFPPYNSKTRIYTKGSIKSTRETSDPLHFEQLELSAISFYAVETREYIRRLEFQVSADILSKTFDLIFTGYQLLYTTRYPHALPFISIVMLLNLTLSQMILLALDVSGEIVLLGSVWLEKSKIITRVVTISTFSLQIYLVKLVSSSRKADRNRKSLWDAEKKVTFASLRIHAVGLLIALVVHWMRNVEQEGDFNIAPSASHLVGDRNQTLQKDLKSYVGFLVEAFLLPQILFNMIKNSKERALVYPFYVGSAFVKLLSRMYFAYNVLGGDGLLAGRLVYIDPEVDSASGMWVLASTFGGFVFGAIVCLQQHFGNCFIIPARLRGRLFNL